MFTVQLEVLDVQPIDGYCAACRLPELIRVTVTFRSENRPAPTRPVPSIESQVVCMSCGENQ